MEDALGRFDKGGRRRAGDVDKGLRVEVGQGKPRTLYLDDDAVSPDKSVVYVRHGVADLCHLVWLQSFGAGEGSPEACAHRLSDPAVVGRNVFEEPDHGVGHVRAFICLPWRGLIEVRTHVEEVAFRLEAAADILEDEDVAGAVELGRGAELRTVAGLTVG